MNIQASLFDNAEVGRARHRDPDTAKAAAKSTDATRLEGLVLEELRKAEPDGLTTEELADRLGISLVSVSPRLRPLVNKGRVIDSGGRRRNRSGKKAIVWCEP